MSCPAFGGQVRVLDFKFPESGVFGGSMAAPPQPQERENRGAALQLTAAIAFHQRPILFPRNGPDEAGEFTRAGKGDGVVVDIQAELSTVLMAHAHVNTRAFLLVLALALVFR